MTATTERRTLATAAQDVVDSARYETECYVTVERVQDLAACIPEQQAMDRAVTALLAAVTALLAENRVCIPPGVCDRLDVVLAAADAVKRLLAPEPTVCTACGGTRGGWDRPSPCPRCDGTGVEP